MFPEEAAGMLSEKFPLLERRLRRVQRFRLRPCARGLEVGGAVAFSTPEVSRFPIAFLKARALWRRAFSPVIPICATGWTRGTKRVFRG